MKLKKLLAGVTAAALAVGLVAVTPLMASAAGKTEEIPIDITGAIETWDGKTIPCEHQSTHTGEAAWDQYEKAEFIVTLSNMDSSVIAIKAAAIAGWNWVVSDELSDEQLAADGTYTMTFDFSSMSNDDIEGLTSMLFRVETNSNDLVTDWGITAKLVLTQKEGAVALIKDEWYENADGKWEILSSEGKGEPELWLDLSDYTSLDYADITNITVNYTVKGDYAGGSMGINNAVSEWTQAEWTNADSSVSMDIEGVEPGAKLKFQPDWMNGSVTLTIDSIVITGASNVPVTDITVAPATAEIKVGETATFTATVEPENATDKTVTWTSSDENVAKVDSKGVVTGVAAGEATITATAGTQTATATVTVTVPEKPEDPTPVDPKPEDPTPVDPKPEDPTPVDPTPGTPETPAIVPTATNNRVGDGGSVPTDVNTGAAFTGTRAMEEVSKATSGSSINVVMTNGMSEGEIIAKIAYKKDVTVNLKYSAYTVSINSDDVAEDFEAKGFYSTSRFLSADEKAAFAGAKELRQISVKNLNGVEKATVTVTMRGGSKGMSATALLRTSAGKYKTVETGKVADDRTFSFEVTKAGNYVVYAGKVDMGE